MIKISVLSFICLLLVSCTSDNKKCSAFEKTFLDSIDSMNLDKYYGLTLTVRGRNEDGSLNVRSIQLNTAEKEIISIPSFQDKLDTDLSRWKEDIQKFAAHYNITEENSISFVEDFSQIVVKEFLEMNIPQLNSQLHSGEFIEFKLNDKCSLFFKKKDAVLNDYWENAFEKMILIKPNWYKR